MINIEGCVSDLFSLLLFEIWSSLYQTFDLIFEDIESVESMYKYLIKESPINDRPELLFLGELSINGYFVGKMGHLVIFVFFFLSELVVTISL